MGKQFCVLLKVQLLGAFGINKALHARDSGEKKKLIGFTAMMAFAGVMIVFAIVTYSVLMGIGFQQIGAPELMPAVMMAVASLITLFTTVYKVNGVLFGFRDYDMTMALPVPTAVVVAVRLSQLYLMDLGFSAMVLLPSGIVYAVLNAPPWWFYPLMPVLLLFVPMVPMILALAAGSLITLISSRFRRTSLINLLLTAALVIGLMALSTGLPAGGEWNGEDLSRLAEMLSGAVYGLYPPVRLYTDALCRGKPLSLLLFALLSAALFAGFCVLIGRIYKSLNTALTTSRTSSRFRMKALKVSTPLNALYKRELRRYFSSPLYVMNTAIGMILAVLASGALLFMGAAKVEQLLEIPGLAALAGDFAPFALSMLVGMSCTTMCSVSLEGSRLWLAKSLPVTSMLVFGSKILVNLTVTVPLSLLCSGMIALALPLTGVQLVFLFLTPLAFALLMAAAGLLINLYLPNLTWTNEAQVIKQSVPSFLCVMGGMLLPLLGIAAVAACPAGMRAFAALGVTGAVLLAALGAFLLLRTQGVRLYRELN